KERKKLEKEEKSTDAEQEGGVASESESESEEEKEEVERVVPPAKNKPTPPLAVSGNKSNRQPPVRTPEEEPEWDVRSAFVANAASHIRPKARTSAGHASRENKENEARTSEVWRFNTVCVCSLPEKGIQLFKQGQYSQAVDMFSEAIHCDPKDHRFFGNRSYCYWCLELYPSALSDAQKSIQLAPDWPKGYFRKGSALMGLKRYGEAERAMQQVLKLDQNCEEASIELFNCKVLQLMDLGFEEGQSVLLLEKFTTVSPCPSLWVGNVTVDLTEKHIWDLFQTCGEIESIRVLHERFCAFVNFKNANMAARALERLQGVELKSTRLVIRYPDRVCVFIQFVSLSPRTRRMAPINGDECFFWRTTGCFYGDKCRFKHKPDQRGKDRKPWQP
uniref:Uncharacterized LOC115147486 n=1 Tax=Salmo trutta TaxID=8032 RepID=A0A674CLB2_SALTR